VATAGTRRRAPVPVLAFARAGPLSGR